MKHWFEGHIDAIAQMLRDGHTASQIAPHFGATRNAVIGLVGRNPVLREIGFARKPGENLGCKVTVSVAQTRTLATVRGGKASANRIRQLAAPPPLPTPVMTFGAPHTAGIPLLMFNEHRCKWPINDGGPFIFCGETTGEGRQYCAWHASVAIGKGTVGEQMATGTLRRAA